MMSKGTTWRAKWTRLINTHGSTAVITPRTVASGTRGGRSGSNYTEGTAVSTVAVPMGHLTGRTGTRLGKVKVGSLTLSFKGTETIDSHSKITFQGKTYDIEQDGIDRKVYDDVVAVIKLTLKEDLS